MPDLSPEVMLYMVIAITLLVGAVCGFLLGVIVTSNWAHQNEKTLIHVIDDLQEGVDQKDHLLTTTTPFA